MSLAVREMTIPDVDWKQVARRINAHWKAKTAPHISIMAQTRAGKSYLVRHGILPLCKNDRVLMIDVKGNDETLNGWGRPVRAIPARMRRSSLIEKPKPGQNWFRLITYPDFDRAAEQVHEAFETVMKEGSWVIVIDELRAITDPRAPGLNLKPDWERFILRGGSNDIATINLSQEPRWCPGSFYTQSNFYFISRIEDEAAQKRLGEIGSTKELVPHIRSIPRRFWLYMDNIAETGERFWARTTVKKGA